MRSLKFVVLFFALPFNMSGQIGNSYLSVGLGMGTSDIVNHSYLMDRYQSRLSSSISFGFGYKLSEKCALVLGLAIEQRGGKFQAVEQELIQTRPNLILGNSITRQYDNRFAYMNAPVLFNYTIAKVKMTDIKIGIGGYYSRLVNHQLHWEPMESYSIPEENTLEFDYRPWDAGWLCQLGIHFELKDQLSLSTNLNYGRGQVNIIDDNIGRRAVHSRLALEVMLHFDLSRV